MTRDYIIYGLYDPETGELRYIGKSETGLKRRLAEHQMPSYLSYPCHKNSWVKSLLAKSLRPVGAILQKFENPKELCEAEKYWIAFFRSQGCRLTNMTDGGEGFGKLPVSKETREKLRLAKLGKKLSVEHRRKIGEGQLGRVASLETRAKISAAHRARKT